MPSHCDKLDQVGEFLFKNMSSTCKTQSILIVGAGTIGLSSTLRLALSGYKDITPIDRRPSVPSTYSAGNDLNKIMRAEYEDGWYTDLALVSGKTSRLIDMILAEILII